MPIDFATRYALFEVAGGRCTYCGDPIRYRDMELDHVLPKAADAAERRDLLEAAGLPADWDIDALPNIVPACRACNRNKAAILANPRQIIIVTGIAERRMRRVIARADKFRRDAEVDKLRALLDQTIAGGSISWDDLKTEHAEIGERSLRLSRPVSFLDLAISEITDDGVERFRQEALSCPPIEMQFRDGTRRAATTVAEYEDYRTAGAFAPTATAMRVEGFFKNAGAIFRAVRVAQIPDHTYIENPHAGVCDLDLLPSTLLQYLGPPDEWMPIVRRFATIGDFVRGGEAEIRIVGSSFVQIRPTRGLDTTIGELLRADLDGDGIEDILISIYGRAVGGSHGHSPDPMILSRRGPAERFEVSKFYA